MKVIKGLFCTLCVFVLVGCGQMIQNIPAITGAGSSAYVGYDEVANIILSHLDGYSSLEIAALKRANKELIAGKLEIERLAGKKSVAELVMSLPELMPLYDSIKCSYGAAHTIVMSRIDTYSLHEQLILREYARTCSRLDHAVTDAMTAQNGVNNEQIVRDVLNFVGLVAKIVIPLLIL